MQHLVDWVGMAAVLLLGVAVAQGLLSDGLLGNRLLVDGAGSAAFGALDWAILAISVPAGLAAADLVSGLAHWLADRVLSEDTPIFGPYLVRPFQEHHRDPRGILRHDWSETIGSTCFSVTPLLVVALAAVELATPGPTRTAIGSLALSLAGWLCLTNQIHKWAHTESPSRWVEALQRSGLVLSAQHHARHHAEPYDVRYCITTGWFNSVLDRMGFFARVERMLRLPAPVPAMSGGNSARRIPERPV